MTFRYITTNDGVIFETFEVVETKWETTVYDTKYFTYVIQTGYADEICNKTGYFYNSIVNGDKMKLGKNYYDFNFDTIGNVVVNIGN